MSTDPASLAKMLAGAVLAGGGDEAGRSIMRELCSALGQFGDGIASALGLGEDDEPVDETKKQKAGHDLANTLARKLKGMKPEERGPWVRQYLDKLMGAHGADPSQSPQPAGAALHGQAPPQFGWPPGYPQPGVPMGPPGQPVWTAYGWQYPLPGYAPPPQPTAAGGGVPAASPYPMPPPGYPAMGGDPAQTEQMRLMMQAVQGLAASVAELKEGGGKKKERRRLFGPAVQVVFVLFLLFNSFFSHLWVPAVERWFYSNWNHLWRSEGISHTLYLQKQLADCEKAEALALADLTRLDKELSNTELKGAKRIELQTTREEAGVAYLRLRTTAAQLRARLAEYGNTAGYNKTPESLYDEAKGGPGGLPIP